MSFCWIFIILFPFSSSGACWFLLHSSSPPLASETESPVIIIVVKQHLWTDISCTQSIRQTLRQEILTLRQRPIQLWGETMYLISRIESSKFIRKSELILSGKVWGKMMMMRERFHKSTGLTTKLNKIVSSNAAIIKIVASLALCGWNDIKRDRKTTKITLKVGLLQITSRVLFSPFPEPVSSETIEWMERETIV